MIQQPEIPVSVNIQFDNQYMEKYAKEYIRELFDQFLRPEWLTIADMEKITRRKRAWIMEYIVYDPYVRNNKLAKRDTDGKWIFVSEKIRLFLDRLFDDLPDY